MMDIELLKYFLPDGLLEYFKITKVEEVEEVSQNRRILQIELEETNIILSSNGATQYESKGFFPAKIIQDFPVNGKEVNLVIKRRR